MKKQIQKPTGFQTVDSTIPGELKYFNAEELAMKLCEDCKAFTKVAK